jgi:hypothetical protein
MPDVSGKEDIFNKTTVIDGTATNTLYPSALATRVYVETVTANLESLLNKVTEISLPTNAWQYPNTQAVVNWVNTKIVDSYPTWAEITGVLLSGAIPIAWLNFYVITSVISNGVIHRKLVSHKGLIEATGPFAIRLTGVYWNSVPNTQIITSSGYCDAWINPTSGIEITITGETILIGATQSLVLDGYFAS